ncbi:DNA repair protein RAD50, ABC-type ATPase/SMC superfamily [Aspergillus campestris IBT 28561]|uniref:DNA repair protein RAD50 n=1 Tax=Aspergillus campestris (strain IBT 28561) TaxID=1392248 RepID=A0A2I1DBQ2_ASPC2|nr:DNA repair protein RAD50, ABC-type ATPase/SMC superfamily [Aspergillus campestris IBT 28561]PKY07304.1 DNA repair protein RAD50, ABC-type ATPase/SMC superfamily [Aspergillus campestris IBT 28561]
MSKIDKLSILGIRSFDNTRSETIQFHTPLTLIVGYNGSGKTTIIECLKYATTGDLPPNSKGGAFIHDPKLCGEKEVLAQVKLSFKGTSGAKMVATRSLQLTVKKTTRQQKTLEGQLLMVKDGERTAISSRVAELDQIMPQYLGVSRAVLDSVIFCHQDESLWPMSEPSALKKRFDEIFEAMKYTKAIDNIKVLRKKQNEELAKFKIMEQHSKEDKEKADRAEKRSIKLQDEIEALRDETHQLSQEMRRVAELADKAWTESETYAQILGALEGKRIEAKSVQATIDNLQRHLVELDDPDEWLESNLEQFESRQIQFQQQEEAQKENYMALKERIESSRQRLGAKQAECGKYENDQANFERQVERRQRLTQEIARANNIRGFDSIQDQAEVDEFMHKIRKLLKDQNLALDRAKRDAQSELREVQATLNEIGQRKSALQESKNAAKRQIAANDREAGSYQARLDEIDVDEGVQAALEANVEDVVSRLDQAKARARSASWDQEIQTMNAEIRNLEDESTRLNAELIDATKMAGDLARLDHLKKELKERERSLDTMKGAHGERLAKLINSDWQPHSLEHDFQRTLDEESRVVSQAEQERDTVSRDLEQVEFKLKNTRKMLAQRQKELQECVEEIREAVDDEPEEYPEIVQQRQAQLEIARKDAEQYAGVGEYLTKCLDTAKQAKACRMCSRGFRNDSELQAFRNKLEALVKKARQDIEDEELRNMEEDLKTARAANTAYDMWSRLGKTDIPELEKEEELYISQRDALLTRVEEHDQKVGEKAEKKREVEGLSKTVNTIIRYDGEITSIRSQIQDLSSKQENPSGTRTLEDIQEEIASLGERSRKQKQTLSKLTHDREQAQAEINSLELQLRDVKSNLDNTRFRLEKKADLLTRLEEYKNLNSQQRDAITRADQEIEALTPELLKVQAKYDDISQRAEAREREMQQGISQLSENVRQLGLANEEIDSYNERGGPHQLERSQRELQTIEHEIGDLEAELGTITREINKISAQLKDSENTKRQYADNLTYRQATRARDAVTAEIEQLAAQNAEVDRGRFKEESERRTREHNALAAKQASKMGEMKSKDDQLMQLLADWNTDYKDAASKYKEAHIKVETTKAAADDLARYGGALDKAIMKYHGLKMEEINAIIGELWQRTYRGTDVDTIAIRSDNENAKGNRSYNYRVCMVKQGAEMDMRGRCSAGQKVLACIIIRLALAECFGVNCGLIALDEPTTNLDRDNIRSLAESLHEIIRARQQQANFQLIVITHDEDFLRHMQCGDFSDYYYRVSRNERQKSIIERQSIAEVM